MAGVSRHGALSRRRAGGILGQHHVPASVPDGRVRAREQSVVLVLLLLAGDHQGGSVGEKRLVAEQIGVRFRWLEG